MPDTLKVHRLLTKQGLTVAVAESCTGGLLAAELTGRSGSSAFFRLGVVAYSNQAKRSLLGVSLALLNGFGAVSEPAARSMAEKVRRLAKSDIGISVTGIAGPTGGTKRKPVGTVYIALADRTHTLCEHHRFRGARTSIRRQAVAASLRLLASCIELPL